MPFHWFLIKKIRVPHPRSEDRQGQETFLAPSAGKQTRNYDTECSNHLYIIDKVGINKTKFLQL